MVQMAETHLEVHTLSKDELSEQTNDPGLTGKITDYNNVSASLLLPKLHSQGVDHMGVTGRTQHDGASTKSAFAEGVAKYGNFENLNLGSTKTEHEQVSESGVPRLGSQDMIRELEQLSPMPAYKTQCEWPNGAKPLDNDDCDELKRSQAISPMPTSAVDDAEGQKANSPKSGPRWGKTRTKSVLTTNNATNLHLVGPKPKHLQKANLNSQAKIDSEGFELVANRKQMVPNIMAEQQNWQRKRNAMSKNEIKRQSTLLSNLPMITTQMPNKNR